MNEEAYEEYSIALELDAKSLATWVNRAELSLQTGGIDNALGDLREAIRLDPQGDTPFGVRARALAQATATILQEAMLQKGIDPDAVARKGSKETDKVGTNQRGYQQPKAKGPAATKRK